MKGNLTMEEFPEIVFKWVGRLAVGSAFVSSMLLLSLIACSVSHAEDEVPKTLFGDTLSDVGITVSGSMGFYSKYIWRGFKLDDDPVFQPSLTISAKGFSINAWTNFDVDNDDALNSDEIDTVVSYAHTFENVEVGGMTLKPITATIGHTYYAFTETSTFSKETMLGLGYGSVLNPSFFWYHDYGKESKGGGHGDYYVINLSQSIPLMPDQGITLDLGGHYGYNKDLFITGSGSDVLLSTGFTIPLTANLKILPSANWSFPMGDLEDDTLGNQDYEFYTGAVLTFSM